MSHALLPRITSRTVIFIAWSSSSHHQLQGASSVTFIEAEKVDPIGTAEAVTGAAEVIVAVIVVVSIIVVVILTVAVFVEFTIFVAMIVDVAVIVPILVVVKELFTVAVELLVDMTVTVFVVAGIILLIVVVVVVLVQPIMLKETISMRVKTKCLFILSTFTTSNNIISEAKKYSTVDIKHKDMLPYSTTIKYLKK
jgi:hypothetical protein